METSMWSHFNEHAPEISAQAFRGETGIQDQFSFLFCIIISWKITTLPPTMYKTNEEANKARKSLIGYDKDKVSGQVCLRLSTHPNSKILEYLRVLSCLGLDLLSFSNQKFGDEKA